MKIPLRLRRRRTSQPADALLLPSTDTAKLLEICARIGTEPLPHVFLVAGGFLLELVQPTKVIFPGTLRLRALCPNCYLPVDGELTPPLWDDETRGLVQQRGLVFLPGNRVLAFAVNEPLLIATLLTIKTKERGTWQPLPAPPPLAERLEGVELDVPQPSVDVILEKGGEGIGSDAARPPGARTLDTIGGHIAMTLGKGLMGLGNMLHLSALARAGARWIEKAVERVPRLSERVLGRQEAALRDLLRLFRDGKLEQALRRALPLGSQPGRGSTVAQNAILPFQSLFYSLANILGARGPASLWFGGYDVQRELANEYRAAAERARRQGDFRRAAFIYGKLLNDFRAAANVLFQGGLYRDAAIIYLTLLNDRTAAARAYEAGGEFEKALQLYRQMGDHLAAADLLRRIGEDEAALAEYTSAANKLVEKKDWLAAGELLWNKAGRPDLAEAYWQHGWARRPAASAVPCGLRLANLFQAQSAPMRLLELVREGRRCFDPPGNDVAAVDFYENISKLSDQANLASIRDEVRDNSLLGVVAKVRQRVTSERHPGDLVSRYLGSSGVWPAPVVSDGQYAVKAAVKRSEARPGMSPRTGMRTGTGNVTAVCRAANSGDVFIAFDSGDLVCFRPFTSDVRFVRTGWLEFGIASLAVDPEGKFLVMMESRRTRTEDGGRLTTFARRPDGMFDCHHIWNTPTEPHWLTPTVASPDHYVGIWDGTDFKLLMGHIQTPIGRIPVSPNCCGALLLTTDRTLLSVLHWNQDWVFLTHDLNSKGDDVDLSWTPPSLRNEAGRPVVFDWRWSGQKLELAGIDEQGRVQWSRLAMVDGRLTEECSDFARFASEGYRAAAIVRPGVVAAVSKLQVEWLRIGRPFFTFACTPLPPGPPIVSCSSSLLTSEIILVRIDGTVHRVTIPANA
jgi:tetratricopeptide (TPR) repeat protein